VFRLVQPKGGKAVEAEFAMPPAGTIRKIEVGDQDDEEDEK